MRDEQQRAHVGDRGAHRMALLAEDVPEHDGARRRTSALSAPICFRRSSSLATRPRLATCRRDRP